MTVGRSLRSRSTDANPPGSASIGSLVRDATEQMSTLVRAEVALAKAEVTGEIKKGLTAASSSSSR